MQLHPRSLRATSPRAMEHEIPTLESLLRDGGATFVRVRFGSATFAEFDFERSEGWNVFDDSRRYPRQIAASLSFEDAARYAAQFAKRVTEGGSE